MQKKKKQIRDFYDLAFRSGLAVKLVNLVTLYRIITFPLLIVLVFTEQKEAFKWLLGVSFFTDAIDGQLARRFNAQSILGARLDSIGDDLTVAAGAFGLAYFRWEFFREQLPILVSVFVIFLVQTIYALVKYGKPTTFHTYLAKLAAVLQGLFLLSAVFFDSIIYWLYYSAIIVTSIQLLEEIFMVYLIPKWKNDVKGIYWAMRGTKDELRRTG
jgi:phosphatidylglycerophosphate synthase